MSEIDAFYGVLAAKLAPVLETVDPSTARTRYWIVIQDAVGVEVADFAGSALAPHELLSSLVAKTVNAAAFVTYVPGDPERVLAQALVASPRDSDTREAIVVRTPQSPITLGSWEHTV